VLDIIKYPLPSYTKGRTRQVSYGVIHYVSAKNVTKYKNDPYNIEGCLEIFKNDGPKYKFSCHYLIARNGQTYQMIDIKNTAWHAGKSVVAYPHFEQDINPSSIGIELVGMLDDSFTNEQYQSLAELSVYIEEQVITQGLGIIKHWTGHSNISGEIAVKLGIKEANVMKKDPGELFDWQVFYREKARVILTEEIKISCVSEITKNVLSSITTKECITLLIQKLFKKK